MTNRFGTELSPRLTSNYFSWLVSQFYKILPIRESNSPTLSKYICSLQRELLGCKSFIPALCYDEYYLSLLSILEYMKTDYDDVSVIRSEVFKSISIIKKLQNRYDEQEVQQP